MTHRVRVVNQSTLKGADLCRSHCRICRYAKDALEPYISAKTLEFHHDKHHKAYVDNGNKLIAGTDLDKEDAEAIIKKVAGDASKAGIFNNAAQAWNHSFYWTCLKPKGGGRPTGQIAQKIDA